MRDLRWDNIRFVLIYLVVFGHLLELCQGGLAHVVYQAIYSFHMPAFIFVTGYFAKFKTRTLATLTGSYVLFQTLYLLFNWSFLSGFDGQLVLQYVEPYWLMWYLMATVFYYLLVPVLKHATGRWRMAVVAACALISVLSGYLPVSRLLTLSRVLAYLPFFVAGFYLHERVRAVGEQSGDVRDLFDVARKPLALAACGVAALGGFVVLQLLGVSNEVLYCASSYEMSWGNPLIRLVQIVTASGAIGLLFACAREGDIPYVTKAGQNTMPVFLLHGFFVRALAKMAFVPFEGLLGIVVALLCACVLVFVLAQPALNALVRFSFRSNASKKRSS